MKKRILSLFLAAALLLSGCAAPAPEPSPAPAEDFSLDFLATGKSDCAVLRLDGLVLLMDAADADDRDAICACLDGYGAERIDYLLLSHYDKDHIGSAAALLERYPVGQIIGPDYTESSEEYRALEKAAEETGTPWLRLTETLTLPAGRGSLELDPPSEEFGSDNDRSLIVTLSIQGRRLLFLGDAEKQRMEDFAARAAAHYDLVKLPHHGDSSKPLLKLLKATRPAWCVELVSPEQEVDEGLTEVLEQLGAALLRSDRGPIHVTLQGTELQATQSAG